MKATTAPTSPPASVVEPTNPALLPILAMRLRCGGGCGCGCQSGAPCQCGGAAGGCCGGH